MTSPLALRKFSNPDLLSAVARLAADERRITLSVLEHFREIERRKAYADLGYKSLFEYSVRHLHYSEASASRRIAAMHALKENPELGEKIQSGKTTVTTIAKIQTTLRRDEKLSGLRRSSREKRAVFAEMDALPAKALERKLCALAPEASLRETRKPVTESLHEIKIFLSDEDLATLDVFKGRISHALKNPGSYSEVFQRLIRMGREVQLKDLKGRTAHLEKAARSQTAVSKRNTTPPEDLRRKDKATHKNPPKNLQRDASPLAGESVGDPRCIDAKTDAKIDKKTAPKMHPTFSRYVTAAVRRAAFVRAGFRCEFRDPWVGRCLSNHFLQIEHRHPVARGGTHRLANLEILCRDHNLVRGVRAYGAEKMRRS